MNCAVNKKTLSFIFAILFSLILPLRIFAVNKPVYNSNEKQRKKIALTFDDGPHPRITVEIVDILKKYGIKATFFVVGVNAKNYPEALSYVISNGNEIGNHTYSHKILKNKSKENIYKEILNTEAEILKYTESSTSLIRPPCGLYDKNLIELALENQYKIVLWNIDTKDWEHKSCDQIVKNVIDHAKGGDIILFHDYISGENNTPKALNLLIPKMLSLGYEFVTVSELLQES